MRTAASKRASVKTTAAPELDELLVLDEDELLVELDELLLELLADELLLPELVEDVLLEDVLLAELLLDDELLEELLESLTPPLLSPESFELHAANSNEHINADKILGTAFLQAV